MKFFFEKSAPELDTKGVEWFHIVFKGNRTDPSWLKAPNYDAAPLF